MFADAIESILKAHLPAATRAAERGEGAEALRDALQSAGFFELLASEEDGGAALDMRELFPVVTLCGAWAVPLPLVQTMAARLLVAQHSALPEGTITFATGLSKADGRLQCSLVPFGMIADHVLASNGPDLLLLPVAQAGREPVAVRGSLTASLSWNEGHATSLAPAADNIDLQALGAVLHAGMLAGAAKRVFDMTLQYGNERVQFGKSIGKFQAIQHQLSVMAEHVAAASIAAEAAFQCGRRVPSVAASAVAKSRTSEAAQLVASIAHAVHGAIGVTEEYDLQIHTRRLHEWRMAHGSENHWNLWLGRRVLQSRQALLSDHVRGLVA
jgi:acyl-CoA dehydrogenase